MSDPSEHSSTSVLRQLYETQALELDVLRGDLAGVRLRLDELDDEARTLAAQRDRWRAYAGHYFAALERIAAGPEPLAAHNAAAALARDGAPIPGQRREDVGNQMTRQARDSTGVNSQGSGPHASPHIGDRRMH